MDGCCEREVEILNKVQLEAARIVTGLTTFASRESLYFETVWETLTERRKNRKLCIFYRMHNNICPQYLSDCLPTLVSNVSGYNLRNNDNYVAIRTRLNVYAKSCVPSTISLWNNLETSIRSTPTLDSFKIKLKTPLFKPPKYFGEGSRRLNIIHARLRHQCSSLNADLYRINLAENPNCNCGAPYEDAIHYFLECPLYQIQTANLFNDIENIELNIETILFGNEDLSLQINTNIFEKVRNCIGRTNRFPTGQ